MTFLPPLPADDGSCRIELYGPPQVPTEGDRWGQAHWGSGWRNNILPNSSFETGAGWELQPSASLISEPSAPDGLRVLHIAAAAGEAYPRATQRAIPVKAGTTYRLYATARKLAGALGPLIRVQTSAGVPVNVPLGNSANWGTGWGEFTSDGLPVDVSCRINAPDGAVGDEVSEFDKVELLTPYQPVWSGGPQLGWQDVTPQSLNLQVRWGVDDPAGVLSAPAAGSWDVTTYDPKRLLDPSNYESAYFAVLRPGGLVRVMFNDNVVRVGFIDEIEYDVESRQGSIRASDGISLMVKAKCPPNLNRDKSLPLTLRARARAFLDLSKVIYIAVEATPAGEVDPLVGEALEDEVSPWQQIMTAALDALHAVWLDRNGVLRFRHFAKPRATSLQVGGSAPGAIAIDAVTTKQTLENAYTHVRTLDDDIPTHVVEIENSAAEDLYGNLMMVRTRSVPEAQTWVKAVLDDRSGVNPQYLVGTLRPQTPEQLEYILDLGLVDEIGLSVHSVAPPINRTVRVLGGRIEANTETGWSAGLGTYEPGVNWQPAPPVYPLRLTSDRDMFIVKDHMGGGYTDSQFQWLHVVSSMLTAGPPPEVQALTFLNFPAIDWTGITRIKRAKLGVYFPVEPVTWNRMNWFYCHRVTGAWGEGVTYAWPGPAVTEEGKWANELPISLGWWEFEVGDIVRAWSPVAIGGQGAAQNGIRISPFADQWQSDPPEEAWLSSHRVQDSQGDADPAHYPYLLLYVER